MKRNIGILFLFDLLYWMVIFFLYRLMFLVYHSGEASELPFSEISASFWHGLILDFSMSCYLSSIPLLIYVVFSFYPKTILLRIRNYLVLLFLTAVTAITVADLEIYREWGIKINSRAIRFLSQPFEVVETARTSFLIAGFIAIAVLVFIFYRVYLRVWRKEITSGILTGILLLLAGPFILFAGMRGGFGSIPLQMSDAYYSKSNFLNLTSTNTAWQLIHSLIENKKLMEGNPFVYYDEQTAEETVRALHSVETDSTLRILKQDKPNVIFIIMEGVSSEMVSVLGGYKDVTPTLDQLCREGVSFDSLYSSGNLSDQGMSTLFSGFPAQPVVSITTQPDKFRRLPSLTKEFKKLGYYTSFMFGGELSYGNIRAYMIWNEFDKITEAKDLEEFSRGKLGVHDEFVFQRQLEDLRKVSSPFFAAIFTGSTHSPYDHPKADKQFEFGKLENDYVNSVYYFDQQLKKFIDGCRNEAWFKNTLFVLISDHSHKTPKGIERTDPAYRRIPLIFWGEPLADEWKGKKVSRICSQVDLTSTLLHQLGADASAFPWSRNLFNPTTPEFAFFENTDGFGWIRPSQHIVWSHDLNHFHFEKVRNAEEKARMEKEGKSYLQVLFGEYWEY